eukprot:SAG31_NODE_1151_length_9643_cov_15.981978_7_plen_243_part_00
MLKQPLCRCSISVLGWVFNDLIVKQYIPNACGTIGLLHAASNLAATGEVPAPAAESWLAKFLEKVRTLDAAAAGQLLENDVEIEEAHAMAESESVDAAARHEDVYRHFISFIERDGSIWELDGMKVAPVNLGPTSKVTFLKDTLQAIKERFVELAPDNAQDFVIFALAPAGANATGMALGIEAGSSHTSPQSVDIDEADVTELVRGSHLIASMQSFQASHPKFVCFLSTAVACNIDSNNSEV